MSVRRILFKYDPVLILPRPVLLTPPLTIKPTIARVRTRSEGDGEEEFRGGGEESGRDPEKMMYRSRDMLRIGQRREERTVIRPRFEGLGLRW